MYGVSEAVQHFHHELPPFGANKALVIPENS